MIGNWVSNCTYAPYTMSSSFIKCSTILSPLTILNLWSSQSKCTFFIKTLRTKTFCRVSHKRFSLTVVRTIVWNCEPSIIDIIANSLMLFVFHSDSSQLSSTGEALNHQCALTNSFVTASFLSWIPNRNNYPHAKWYYWCPSYLRL